MKFRLWPHWYSWHQTPCRLLGWQKRHTTKRKTLFPLFCTVFFTDSCVARLSHSIPLFGPLFVKRFALCYRTVVLCVLSCLSVTLVHCGQTVRWIKMPLGMEAGLGPGHILLDRDPPTPHRGHRPPIFGQCLCDEAAGWIKVPVGREVGLGPGDILLHGDPAPQKGGTAPPTFRPVSIVGKRLDGSRIKMPLGREVGLGPGHIVLDGDPAPSL